VDSLVLIERLDELMAEAKPIPFTREARVDRDEVYKILDRIRTTLPVEFERARWTGREDSQEDAVETQLRQIGASIAEVRRVQHGQAERPSAPPLTIAAAEQVREIVEAAERTAAQLEQEASVEAQKARAEAARNLKDAREESERLLCDARERAAADAADYLRRVEEATKKMLERAAAADSEINGMLARLRGSGGSVMEDLEAIMSGLTEIEVRRNGAPTEDPQKQTPARSGDEPASGVTSGGGAATAVVVRPQQGAPAALARRPAHTSVEGLQDPPEPPAVRPQPRSTSAVGERPAVPAGSPQPQPSPPSAA
jgi:F0F1-type ATP synthase membrane subunit b/b'